MKKMKVGEKIFGYREKGPCCGNCEHFVSEIVEKVDKLTLTTYKQEKKMRCSLYNSPVKKRGWCPSHVWSYFYENANTAYENKGVK